VIVPLDEERHLGGEAALVLVHEVVGEGAAVLAQALADFALLRRRQVPPDPAVVDLHLGLDRPVGIDLVARVDEEVGLLLAHRFVELVAAELGVDAPALAGLVAGEGEGDRLAPRGRGPERAD
jgi:hypothetical protein